TPGTPSRSKVIRKPTTQGKQRTAYSEQETRGGSARFTCTTPGQQRMDFLAVRCQLLIKSPVSRRFPLLVARKDVIRGRLGADPSHRQSPSFHTAEIGFLA